MAKKTYYEIDPISSTAVALNDSSGTPNTEVLSCRASWSPAREIVSLVGCDNPAVLILDGGTRDVSLILEIQDETMANVFTKLSALDRVCRGDQSVPIDYLTKDTFNFAVAIDGSTKYGFKRCKLIRIEPDYRAQYTSGGVDYRLLEAPVFTRVLIEFQSGTSTMAVL